MASNVSGTPVTRSGKSDHEILREMVVARGLLEKQPFFYWKTFFFLMMLIASCGVGLFVAHGWVIVSLVAFLWTFTSTQIGLLGHDLGHRQVFKQSHHNDLLMLVFAPVIGLSPSWWRSMHNAHHNTPNELDSDPHTMIPLCAFSEEQAKSRTGLGKRIVRFQAYYFFPLCLLESVGTKLASIIQVTTNTYRYVMLERLAVAGHLLLYPALILWVLSPLEALVFILVHQGSLGLYLGMLFAPNHKGMEIFTKETRPDSLRQQVLTSRNIRGGWLIDLIYGGLNYQIEHHLFSDMPRNKLREASLIVREFCESQGISYKEVGLLRSYAEVLASMHRVAQAAA